jgi:uncharacterized protein (DUF983 family)
MPANSLHTASRAEELTMDTPPLDQGVPTSANTPDASAGRSMSDAEKRRPLLTGVGRGLARRCPNCGDGRLFDGYLRVRPVCGRCGNDNDRYPADDAPPYVTILLVGHIVVAPMLMLEAIRVWHLWLSLGVACSLVLLVTLALLPFIKGGVIGACWSLDIVRDTRDRPRV